MAHLGLALLGRFAATLHGVPVEGLGSDRLRGLLAYLAVAGGREYPREQVAYLLWPERSDTEALSALRFALSKLHAALDDRRAACPFLLVTRGGVQFNPACDHWLDLAEFTGLSSGTDAAGLERAASLYRGPFLDGLSVGDSPAFDEWQLLKGEEYRRQALSVLERLAAVRLVRGEAGEAARWARRQIELEPYREQAHRQLMAALALRGERAAALAHYERCRRLLAQDLGCEPEDETQALYAQIRAGGLVQLQPSPVILSASLTSPRAAADAMPASRFVAREQELARLDSLLQRALAGKGGVALIQGDAGAGKTALLDEWARRAGQAHADLIVLRGSCNALGGAGDPFLPFREILQTLAGDVEGKRAGGTLSAEQARRVWEALPAVGAALVEHGPDLIDRLVPGEALLRRAEAFPALSGAARPPGQGWQAKLRDFVRRAPEVQAASGARAAAFASQPDLFAQVTQVLHTIALRRPLLLAIDDLQWADGGTAALLFHLGRRLAGSRILLVCAYRPEALGAGEDGRAAASGVGAVIQELRREWGDVLVDLDEADGRAFVEAYVDGEPNRLGAAFRQALYEHTGGNPLFTVELLRSFARQGALVQDEAGRWIEAAGPDWERRPPEVEAVIAGHLAALSDEDREVLQAAGVQGEQFAAEVVARALGWDDEAVVRRLSGPLRSQHRLVEAVSLDRVGSSGQRLSRYRFRHALVQRSAYRSLDAVARARLHEATGRALEALYPGSTGPSLAPELARHYEAAGLPLEAAPQRLEAGRWAVRLMGYDEAIAHLERGLALLERVPSSLERLCLEFSLCLAIVSPAMLQRGVQAPVYTRALTRLADLTQHPDLQDDPRRLNALTVLAHRTIWSADPARGRWVGEQLLGLAPEGDRQSLMLAHWVLGDSCWSQGQLAAAREHLELALAMYDPAAGPPLSPVLGADPGVIARSALGLVQWLQGYPDQAGASFRQALMQAQALERPASTAFAHLLAGITCRLLGRDGGAARAHATALRTLGQAGLIYGAWAELLAADGGWADAIRAAPTSEPRPDPAGEAGSTLDSIGPGAGQAARLFLQAQMYAWAGQIELGLAAVEQAQAWIEGTGMRTLEAEAWRMRGQLLLASGRPGPSSGVEYEAAACFDRALAVARGQQARWLELRAAVSLARLWRAQSRRAEARELLSSIYGWFTEGFDTPDLVEAGALLGELEPGEARADRAAAAT